MRCAVLIETLMKTYERIQAGQQSGEKETPSTNDDRGSGQPEPSSRPLGSATTSLPASAPTNAGCQMSLSGKDYTEADVLEPNSTHGLGIDGLTNYDQMGGIEMFFSQSIWPESVLSGQVGESDGGELASFDLRNLFGFYETPPQL